MRWIFIALAAGSLAAAGCSKDEGKAGGEPPAGKEAPAGKDAPAAGEAPAGEAPAAAPGTAAARRVPVEVTSRGYEPATIAAKPGEPLLLEFHRTDDSECTSSVIVDGKETVLPQGEKVEVAVAAPADGELVFTCGMKMLEGKVKVQ